MPGFVPLEARDCVGTAKKVAILVSMETGTEPSWQHRMGYRSAEGLCQGTQKGGHLAPHGNKSRDALGFTLLGTGGEEQRELHQ